jgi:adenosine deaminase
MKLSKIPYRPVEFYQSLPKVDLHRHLEGSLRFETVRELARAHSLDLPPTAQLRTLVQVQEDEPLTFENFLSKFTTLRLFYRSQEIISRITLEAIQDAAADNVRYLELRFTPVALSKAQGFPLGRVMDWVIEGARAAENQTGVITRLICSINRHESTAVAAQVALLAAERLEGGIVGLDLAGNEADFSAGPFIEIFRYAREKGLHITIHAGEWGTGENVLQAIAVLGAERIGHGVRVIETPQAMELARLNGVAFEVCITSNYQSGSVSSIKSHPVSLMIEQGLLVTLNTDDPSISQIKLSDEYRLACEVLGFSQQDLRQRVLAAAGAAFLPPGEKDFLVGKLSKELDGYDN